MFKEKETKVGDEGGRVRESSGLGGPGKFRVGQERLGIDSAMARTRTEPGRESMKARVRDWLGLGRVYMGWGGLGRCPAEGEREIGGGSGRSCGEGQ